MKTIIWNENALKFVRGLEPKTRMEIGTLLTLLQMGQKLSAPQSKPLKTIHAKAHELRVRDKNGAYRVIYVLDTGEQIFIPHAFSKKTEKTPLKEIELSIRRLKVILDENK